MPTQIPSGLAHDLHPDIVPRHPWDFPSVENVLERLIEVAILGDTLVRVVLASPDGSVRASVLGVIFVREDMLRRVPSAVTPGVS
jgi:hypothetical protein